MSIDSQDIPIALSQGIDTKSDPKQLQLGKMVVLQNASFKSPGEISKRDGFAPLPQAISGGGSVAGGVGIGSFQNELLTLDGNSLYSYSPQLAKQVNKGTLIPVSLTPSTVVRNTNKQTGPDSAFHAGTGFQCFTWIDSGSGGIDYSIIDSTTGTQIVSDAIVISTGTKAKVLTLGVYFIIIYYDTAMTSLEYKVINTATPTTLSGATLIANDISSSHPCFDATLINGSVYIAYDVGNTAVAFYSISSALVLSSKYSITISKQIHSAISVVGDASNNVWVAYSVLVVSTATLWGAIVNSALNATLLVPTQLGGTINSSGFDTFNITQLVSGTTNVIYWEQTDAFANYISFITLTFAGSVGSSTPLIYRMGLASKAFVFNNRNCFIGIYSGNVTNANPNTIEPTYFLLSAGFVIAKIAPSSAGFYYVTGLLPEILSLSATEFSFPYLFQDDLSIIGGAIFYNTGVNNAVLNFQIPNAMPKLVVGQNLHFASGQLWAYDGVNVVEQGFHIYPEFLIISNATSGGGIGSSLNSGPTNQVQYAAVYEWVDNLGQLHRSNPSVPLTIPLPPAAASPVTFTANSTGGSRTLASVSSITGLVVGQVIIDSTHSGNLAAGTYIKAIGASTLTLSEPAIGSQSGDTYSTSDVYAIAIAIPTLTATLKKNVSIALYRTENNQTIFYRVSSPDASQSGATYNNFIYNTTTAESVVMIDILPDSILVGNEQLYTTGGTIGNINAPAVSAIASYQQRMVYLSPENPFQLGYSQQIIDGVPVEFNSLEFVQNLDQKIGQATAIGPMDTELIIFGPKRKFLLTGQGPASNGTQNDFITPTPIAGVSGCSNPISVLELPTGLIYQDIEKGFYLLDRSLQEHYIGAPVEQYNSFLATSANLITNATKCIFTLSNGINLIYDYYVEQWETDPFSSGIAAVDSAIFENDIVYLQANGLSLQQTPGQFTDNGLLIPLGFTTGWMSFAQVAGFQRAWELQITETFKSAHSLTVNIYTDYSTSPTTTKVINVPVAPIPPLFRIHLNVQKCTTIQVQIIESQSAPFGEGLSLSALTFKAGVKKGPYKLPAGNSY